MFPPKQERLLTLATDILFIEIGWSLILFLRLWGDPINIYKFSSVFLVNLKFVTCHPFSGVLKIRVYNSHYVITCALTSF